MKSVLLLHLLSLTAAFAPLRPYNTLKTSSLAMVSTPSKVTPHEIVRVDLPNGRDYPIYIGSSFSDAETSEMLRRHIGGKRVLIVTNDRIAPLYLEKYTQLLDGEGIKADTVVLPDGEENKTYECMSKILDRALELGLDRKSTFVALGGGVIGDMVGFASAIYQRGVNFIQVSEHVVFVHVMCTFV